MPSAPAATASRVGERNSARCARSTSNCCCSLVHRPFERVDLELPLGEPRVEQQRTREHQADEHREADREPRHPAPAGHDGRAAWRSPAVARTAWLAGRAAVTPSADLHALSAGSFSATRSRADAARRLVSCSDCVGRFGTPRTIRTVLTAPHTHGSSGGHSHPPVSACRMRSLAIRSSPEWYDSTASRPPGTSASIALSSASGSASSSPLTSIRIAWNVRLAGWPPVRRAGGRDRRRHDRRQLRCRLDRPGGDDRPGDAVGEALVAVLADHARQLVLGVAVDDVVGGPRGVGVHAHVERPLVAVREPALGAVELRRRHAEVEQRAAQLVDRVRRHRRRRARRSGSGGSSPGRRSDRGGRWRRRARRDRGRGRAAAGRRGRRGSPRHGRRRRAWRRARPRPAPSGTCRRSRRASPARARSRSPSSVLVLPHARRLGDVVLDARRCGSATGARSGGS